MVAVQELNDHDMANCSRVAKRLIGILSEIVIILMAEEAHFYTSGFVNK
jgi:uncharacterized membrane protein